VPAAPPPAPGVVEVVDVVSPSPPDPVLSSVIIGTSFVLLLLIL